MYRRFIATISAVAIAITAIGAAPAHAGDRDTLRALAAIAGVAIVGKLIHDEKKKKRARRKQEVPVYQTPPRYDPPRYDPPRYHPPKPRPLPRRIDSKLLPQKCFRTFETRKGRVAMFAERCLKKNYSYTKRLPTACHYKFGTPKGLRNGFEARCLRDAGYRLARR